MLRRVLQIVIFVPIAVVLIVLSVANRHPVTISLDPFGGTEASLTVSMPLFLVIFGALFVGVVVGGVAAWLSQGKWRRTARRSREEAARWRYRYSETERKQADDGVPRLPALRRSA
jgi:uncharacterized integral membrane protein